MTAQFDGSPQNASSTGIVTVAPADPLTWSFGTITGASNPYKIVMALPKVVYTGETPNVESSEVLLLTVPFKALYDGSNAAWTLVYHTSDTAL